MNLYNFKNPNIYKQKNNYIIIDEDEKYILQTIEDVKRVNEICQILKNKTNHNKIIRNKMGENITKHNNKLYILVKEHKVSNSSYNNVIVENNQNSSINYSDWIKLWERKIDYYDNIKTDDKLLTEANDYYIGLAEIAIQYCKKNVRKSKYLNICNTDFEDMYNPLKVVLDCSEREIGEQIKYYFFYKDINELNVNQLIKNKDIDKIIARLLFPNYYFNLYEYHKEMKKKLIKIISLAEKYEKFIEKFIKENKKCSYLSETTFFTSFTSGISFIISSSIPSFKVISIISHSAQAPSNLT